MQQKVQFALALIHAPRLVARRTVQRFGSVELGAVQSAIAESKAAGAIVVFASHRMRLASAPKSNAVETALGSAMAFVREQPSSPVPLRLRNAPTKLMAALGHGKGYRYAHAEEDAYAAGERYFPDEVPEQVFYQPTERGFEARIAERMRLLRERDDAARRGGEGAGETEAD